MIAFFKPEAVSTNPFCFAVGNLTKSGMNFEWKQMKHTKCKTAEPMKTSNYIFDSLMPFPLFLKILMNAN